MARSMTDPTNPSLRSDQLMGSILGATGPFGSVAQGESWIPGHVPLREMWFEITPWLFVISLITGDESYHRVWNKVNCVYIQDY